MAYHRDEVGPGNTPRLAAGEQRFFISGSWDTAEEAELAWQVINRLSRDTSYGETYTPRRWTKLDKHWSSEKSWQNQIERASTFDCLIFLLGDRVGDALPNDFAPEGFGPADLADLSGGLVAWPGVPLECSQVPLTGTLFEYFDTLHERKKSGAERPDFIFFRRVPPQDADERNLLYLKRAEQVKVSNAARTYQQQIEHADRFVTAQFHGKPVLRYHTIEQFHALLDGGLRRHLKLDNAAITTLNALKPYSVADAAKLFGRKRQSGEIIDAIVASLKLRGGAPFHVIYGESGVGKSSLLQGGVLGGLIRRPLERFEFVLNVPMADAVNPVADLAQAVRAHLFPSEPAKSVDAIAEAGEFQKDRVFEWLKANLARHPQRPNLVIAYDQMEIGLDLARGRTLPPQWRSLFGLLAEVGRERTATVLMTIPTNRLDLLKEVMGADADLLWEHELLPVGLQDLKDIVDQTTIQAQPRVPDEYRERLRKNVLNFFKDAGTAAPVVLPLVSLTMTRLLEELTKIAEKRGKEDAEARKGGLAASASSGTPAHTVKRRKPVSGDTQTADAVVDGSTDIRSRASVEERKSDASDPLIAETLDDGQAQPVEDPVELAASAWSMTASDAGIPLEDELLSVERAINAMGESAWRDAYADASARADGAAADVDWRQKPEFDRLCEGLIDVGLHDRRLFDPAHEADDKLQALLAALKKHWLVVEMADTARVQLAHKTVIDFWDKMSEWFRANVGLIGKAGGLAQRAKRWGATSDPGEKAKYLIGPLDELNDAMETFWAFRKRQDRLPANARDFIRASTLAANLDVQTGVVGTGQTWFWSLAAAAEGDWLEQLLQRLERLPRGRPAEILAARDTVFESTALLEAADTGLAGAVRKMIELGADVNVQQNDGISAVHAAARTDTPGHLAALAVLTERKANIEVRDKNGASPLNLAAEYGLLKPVTYLLDHGADIESRDNTGLTPLNIAARTGKLDVVSVLLCRKAQIDHADSQGFTPLLSAAAYDKPDVMKALIKAGADVNAKNQRGDTALLYAAMRGYDDVVAMLIERSADIHAVGEQGDSPVAVAVGNGRGETTRLLLAAGAERVIRKSGVPLLLAALFWGKTEIAKDLLDGRSIRKVSSDGLSALHAAASANDLELIDMVMRAGAADVNVRDKYGSTPLHYCAAHACPLAARKLIQSGAKPDLVDANGETALHRAIAALSIPSDDANLKQRRTDMLRLLLHSGASAAHATHESGQATSAVTPLHLLAQSDDGAGFVSDLIGHGAQVNAQASDGRTALHVAARAGAIDACKILLERGADPRLGDKNGFLALHYAAIGGDLDVIRVLHRALGDVDPRSLEGWTPLHWAANEGHVEAVKELVALGATDSADVNNALPLHYACKRGHTAVVRYFCHRAADTKVKTTLRAANKWNETCLHFAAIGGSVDCVQALLDADEDYPINTVTTTGLSPLYYSAMQPDPKDKEMDRREEVTTLLLEAGADINLKAPGGLSVLHEAATRGNASVARALLANSIEINERSDKGDTALVSAIRGNFEEITGLLLGKGADVNLANNDGVTPIYAAAIRGNASVFDQLLAAKAALSGETADRSLLEAAALGGNAHIFKTILSHDRRALAKCKKPARILFDATSGGNKEIVETLIGAGVAIDGTIENGATALHEAAYTGRTDLAELLLARGADIARSRDDGKTAMHLAAERGHLDVLRLLVSRHAPVNKPDNDGSTSLVAAIEGKQVEAARFLLSSGASCQARTKDGFTPLHLASFHGNVDLMRLLVERGAEIEAHTDSGLTPLFAAALSKLRAPMEFLLEKGARLDTVAVNHRTMLIVAAESGGECPAFLLEKGVEVNAVDDAGNTALIAAAEKGQTAVVRLLLKAGADYNHASKSGMTALLGAALEGHEGVVAALIEQPDIEVDHMLGELTAFMLSCAKGHVGVAKLLLDRGARIDRVNKTGTSALRSAASYGHEPVVRLLVENGADVNFVRSSDGSTPLTAAAEAGHASVVRYLLDKKAHLNQADSDRRTALMWAARSGMTETVALLLDRGADFDLVDTKNHTALMQAASYGHTDAARLLLARGAELERESDGGWSALTFAAANNRPQTMLFLMEKGAHPGRLAGETWTALVAAARFGRPDTVRALLDARPDLLNHRARDGTTALSIAAQFGHEAVVELLLDRGADWRLTAGPDETPTIMFAAGDGRERTVELLLAAGADVNQTTNQGGTALMLAAQNKHLGTVKLLLAHGADREIRTDDGVTALYYAGEQEEIARLLQPQQQEVRPAKPAPAAPARTRSRVWTIALFVLIVAAAGAVMYVSGGH